MLLKLVLLKLVIPLNNFPKQNASEREFLLLKISAAPKSLELHIQ